jgi:hypothetical protein
MYDPQIDSRLCTNVIQFGPIYLFIDMLTLALELKTTAIAPHIIDTLVPLAQRTADLVVIPRFNGLSPEPFDKDIDSSVCFGILHITALGCMSEQQHIIRFWKLMRWDFVLLMLSPNQPLSDYQMMLRILSTSVFKDSFGAIPGDNSENIYVGYILDRVTHVLYEVPYLPKSSARLEAGVVSQLRLQILQLMTSMTRSPFASKAIAMHSTAIGRIVSLMSDELDVLYDYKTGHEERFAPCLACNTSTAY